MLAPATLGSASLRELSADGEGNVHFDYTTVGHVSVDVLPGGARRAGGSAFYSALQAARLGQRALIITQGVEADIEGLLAPYRSELELQLVPASETTTLQSAVDRASHAQRLLAWAGRMEEGIEINSSIVHLAPIARETPRRWSGSADFIGLTPQGLVRAWAGARREMRLVALAPAMLPHRWDAAVISERERDSCAGLIPPAPSRTPGRPPAAAAGDARPAAASDEARALENFEMLRDAGKAHLEGRGQFRHRRLAQRQPRQNSAPRGIGEGRKGRAEAIGRHAVLSHSVN